MLKYLPFFIILFFYGAYTAARAPASNTVTLNYDINGNPISKIIPFRRGRYHLDNDSDFTLEMVTLDWPPYISTSLCHRGWVFQYVLAISDALGVDVHIGILPWVRAVKRAEMGEVDVLFPEYYIPMSSESQVVPLKKRRELLALSESFGQSNLHLFKRSDATFQYEGELSSLENKWVGLIRGYENSQDVDDMYRAKAFNVVFAENELQSTFQLVARRVDVILADPEVIDFSIKHASLPLEKKNNLMNSVSKLDPPVVSHPLYLAFNQKNVPPKWQARFNEVIKQANESGLVRLLQNQPSEICY